MILNEDRKQVNKFFVKTIQSLFEMDQVYQMAIF